jgi:hypothetical protein
VDAARSEAAVTARRGRRSFNLEELISSMVLSAM